MVEEGYRTEYRKIAKNKRLRNAGVKRMQNAEKEIIREHNKQGKERTSTFRCENEKKTDFKWTRNGKLWSMYIKKGRQKSE